MLFVTIFNCTTADKCNLAPVQRRLCYLDCSLVSKFDRIHTDTSTIIITLKVLWLQDLKSAILI
jgi:hypothetical protein